MRHIVLHYHIFKNAGTTLHKLLQLNFGNVGCVRLEGDAPRRTLPPQRLLDCVHADPALRAISSHQARFPVPCADGIAFYPLVFLRHPLDRVGSVYEFERRQPLGSVSLGARQAREHGLAGYVRWRLQPGNGSVIRNFQTVHLSSAFDDMRTAVAGLEHLDIAMQRLRQLPFVGVVDRFAQSLQQMREYLQPIFGTFNLDHATSNVSEGRAPRLAQRLDAIEEALGPELHAELLEYNLFDLQLYEAALRRYDPAE